MLKQFVIIQGKEVEIDFEIKGDNSKGFVLEKVFNPLVLKTPTGEVLVIAMRDSGYEISYGEDNFILKNGCIQLVRKPYKIITMNDVKYRNGLGNEVFNPDNLPDIGTAYLDEKVGYSVTDVDKDLEVTIETRTFDKEFTEVKDLPSWVLYGSDGSLSIFPDLIMASEHFEKHDFSCELWKREDIGTQFKETFLKSKAGTFSEEKPLSYYTKKGLQPKKK